MDQLIQHKLPTDAPTNGPFPARSDAPTASPSNAPTNSPSDIPTHSTTIIPTIVLVFHQWICQQTLQHSFQLIDQRIVQQKIHQMHHQTHLQIVLQTVLPTARPAVPVISIEITNQFSGDSAETDSKLTNKKKSILYIEPIKENRENCNRMKEKNLFENNA